MNALENRLTYVLLIKGVQHINVMKAAQFNSSGCDNFIVISYPVFFNQ